MFKVMFVFFFYKEFFLIFFDKYICLIQVIFNDFGIVIGLFEQVGLYIFSVILDGLIYWIVYFDGQFGGCIGLEYGQGVLFICLMVVLFDFCLYGLGWVLVFLVLMYVLLCGDYIVYFFFFEVGDYWKCFGFGLSMVVEIEVVLFEVLQV